MTFTLQEWTDQQQRVFEDRYAKRSTTGLREETLPAEMWDRVAHALAEGAAEFGVMRNTLDGFRFVPGGRILYGLDSETDATLYNCFVLGVEADDPQQGNDSRHGIMNMIDKMIELNAKGGGVGVNWSTLRPNGSIIRGAGGVSSGSVPWMSGADSLADAIRQGGSRTAALMYILDDWHPDLIEFVNKGIFNRANYSVNVSDEFMRAVQNDEEWYWIFPETDHPAYNQVWNGDIKRWIDLGLPIKQYGHHPARAIWRQMGQVAWETGNPGLVFLGRANHVANTWYLERLVSTNPCGEQILPVNGSCNLGAVNLVAHWDPAKRDLDWDQLKHTIEGAVLILDRVIDKSPDVTTEIGDLQRQVRRIGISTMGLADLMILSGVVYGSEESLELVDRVYGFIAKHAYLASIKLAETLGPAPALEVDKFLLGRFIHTLPAEVQEGIEKHGIRNMTITTQAPTGTTSILAGVSSGVEPIFRSSYTRSDATGVTEVRHPLFSEIGMDEGWPHLVTADQIPVEGHILVQAAVQQHLDTSVSKTINLPNSATVEDVLNAYELAWENDCKGITIFRDGSRAGVLEDRAHEHGLDCPGGNCEA